MTDQRSEPRQPAGTPARIWVGDAAEPQEAWLKNLSPSGALLQTQPIAIGTVVRVAFGADGEEREVEATVVREVTDMPGYLAGVPGVALRFNA